MITDPTMLSSGSGSVKGVAGGICAPVQGPHDKLNKYPKAQTGRTPAGTKKDAGNAICFFRVFYKILLLIIVTFWF